MLVVNVLGAVLLFLGAGIGVVVGSATAPWIGVVAGSVAAGSIDLAIRIMRGGGDHMSWRGGAMAFFLPVWFVAVVIAPAAVVARFVLWPPPRSKGSDEHAASPPATMVDAAPRTWDRRPAPLGRLEVGAAPDGTATVDIAEWSPPSAALGRDTATVWMIATHIPETLPTEAQLGNVEVHALGVCEIEAQLAFERDPDRALRVPKRGFALAPDVLAGLLSKRPVVAIEAAACADLYAPAVLDCGADGCDGHTW